MTLAVLICMVSEALAREGRGAPPCAHARQPVDASLPAPACAAQVDICESISIAKAMARVNKYQLNYTQELRGLGIANVFGAMFNCYTTTGSFSRSAVNNSVGAKTPLAGMVTGFTIMLVLLVLTPVFTNMSQNVLVCVRVWVGRAGGGESRVHPETLAPPRPPRPTRCPRPPLPQGAIIIVGVLQLFDWQEFIYLWTINKLDWIVWCAAFLFTIFLVSVLAGWRQARHRPRPAPIQPPHLYPTPPPPRAWRWALAWLWASAW